MPTVKGREATRRFIVQAPGLLAAKVLPGAGRAGAKVVADEAKLRLGDRRADVAGGGTVLVADAVKVRVRTAGGRITARVVVQGPGAYVAPWLERGTHPHFISVAKDQRGGRTVSRINRLDRKAEQDRRPGPGHALSIGGNFVSGTVHHPGAQPHPFLTPALDLKAGEAVAAAQAYIDRRVAQLRVGNALAPEGDEP